MVVGDAVWACPILLLAISVLHRLGTADQVSLLVVLLHVFPKLTIID